LKEKMCGKQSWSQNQEDQRTPTNIQGRTGTLADWGEKNALTPTELSQKKVEGRNRESNAKRTEIPRSYNGKGKWGDGSGALGKGDKDMLAGYD